MVSIHALRVERDGVFVIGCKDAVNDWVSANLFV